MTLLPKNNGLRASCAKMDQNGQSKMQNGVRVMTECGKGVGGSGIDGGK